MKKKITSPFTNRKAYRAIETGEKEKEKEKPIKKILQSGETAITQNS